MNGIKRCLIYLAFVLVAIKLSGIMLEAGWFEAMHVWGVEHSANEVKNVYKSYVGNYEYAPVALNNENIIVQEFELTESMLESGTLCIEVLFGAYGRENVGEFLCKLEQGEDYQQELSYEMRDVGEWQYFEMDFNTTGLKAGVVSFEMYSYIATNENCVAPFVRRWNQHSVNKNDINDYRAIDSAQMFHNAKVNGTEQEGPLVMRICTH